MILLMEVILGSAPRCNSRREMALERADALQGDKVVIMGIRSGKQEWTSATLCQHATRRRSRWNQSKVQSALTATTSSAANRAIPMRRIGSSFAESPPVWR